MKACLRSSFNSLFEMPLTVASLLVTAVLVRLSILYLRCATDVGIRLADVMF